MWGERVSRAVTVSDDTRLKDAVRCLHVVQRVTTNPIQSLPSTPAAHRGGRLSNNMHTT